jgi:hypothetical protein
LEVCVRRRRWTPRHHHEGRHPQTFTEPAIPIKTALTIF